MTAAPAAAARRASRPSRSTPSPAPSSRRRRGEFDRRFRPDRGAHQRWRGVWLACARGDELPPVSVYRVGGRHVVRDGHHRISVARDQGWVTIDADVTELH
jgi:hypothetical protein